MSRSLLALALLFLPALVQAGQLTLSPTLVNVDNGEHSTEIVVTYQPGDFVELFGASLVINLDRIGWADVRAIPSTSPDYDTGCQVQSGSLSVWVAADFFSGLTLPTSAPIPLCRLRVRPHANTPRAYYWIDKGYALESTSYGTLDIPANRARVYVP